MVNNIRVDLGVRYFKEHKTELLKAQKHYGVPAYIIAGIIGMETNYGYSPMKFRAVTAHVFTLSAGLFIYFGVKPECIVLSKTP